MVRKSFREGGKTLVEERGGTDPSTRDVNSALEYNGILEYNVLDRVLEWEVGIDDRVFLTRRPGSVRLVQEGASTKTKVKFDLEPPFVNMRGATPETSTLERTKGVSSPSVYSSSSCDYDCPSPLHPSSLLSPLPSLDRRKRQAGRQAPDRHRDGRTVIPINNGGIKGEKNGVNLYLKR